MASIRLSHPVIVGPVMLVNVWHWPWLQLRADKSNGNVMIAGHYHMSCCWRCVTVAFVWTTPFWFCFFSVGFPLFCMHWYAWTMTLIVAGCLTQNCLLWITCFTHFVIQLILMCNALRVGRRCRMYSHQFLFMLLICFPGTSLLAILLLSLWSLLDWWFYLAYEISIHMFT